MVESGSFTMRTVGLKVWRERQTERQRGKGGGGGVEGGRKRHSREGEREGGRERGREGGKECLAAFVVCERPLLEMWIGRTHDGGSSKSSFPSSATFIHVSE